MQYSADDIGNRFPKMNHSRVAEIFISLRRRWGEALYFTQSIDEAAAVERENISRAWAGCFRITLYKQMAADG